MGLVFLNSMIFGSGYSKTFPFIISQNNLSLALGDQVIRLQRNLSSPSGGIDDIGGNRIARGVAPQFFHDLNPCRHGGSEVFRPHGQVALVDIIRSDPDLEELVNQLLHDIGLIVDALQKDGLAPQGNPSVRQFATRPLHRSR